jgi:hypothetical protein
MRFVQLIEFKTDRIDEFNSQLDAWLAATEGRRTPSHALETRDRERDGVYVQIVEFPSFEQAMANSAMPETSALAERLTALCDGPAVFRNLDVVREDNLST